MKELIIYIIFIVSIITFAIYTVVIEHNRFMTAPCSEWKDVRLESVPVRCFKELTR